MNRVYLISAVILLSACNKHPGYEYQGTATIVGFDPRMAPCVGGTYISIDGHPNPIDSVNGYFDIGGIPESFRIDHYPIRVKLDWKINDRCAGNYVDITRIKAIN